MYACALGASCPLICRLGELCKGLLPSDCGHFLVSAASCACLESATNDLRVAGWQNGLMVCQSSEGRPMALLHSAIVVEDGRPRGLEPNHVKLQYRSIQSSAIDEES